MLLYWILLPIVWVLAHIVFRIQVIGRENLKAVRDGRAYVIAPNHIANLDPVLIAITVFDWKRLRILAKEELFKNPLAGWFLRCMGAISIERGKGDTVTLEKITNECKNGTGVMIFPEGTRNNGKELGEFKAGAIRIATRTGVPIVPVCIEGSCRLMGKGSLWIHPAKVTIKILPAVQTEGLSREQIKALPEQLREQIDTQLRTMRNE